MASKTSGGVSISDFLTFPLTFEKWLAGLEPASMLGFSRYPDFPDFVQGRSAPVRAYTRTPSSPYTYTSLFQYFQVKVRVRKVRVLAGARTSAGFERLTFVEQFVEHFTKVRREHTKRFRDRSFRQRQGTCPRPSARRGQTSTCPGA